MLACEGEENKFDSLSIAQLTVLTLSKPSGAQYRTLPHAFRYTVPDGRA